MSIYSFASKQLQSRNFGKFDVEFAQDTAYVPSHIQYLLCSLSPAFVKRFTPVAPPFGFNGLGEFVYQTRYARVLPDGKKEQWYQTVVRESALV
jgi:hypothetical protein